MALDSEPGGRLMMTLLVVVGIAWMAIAVLVVLMMRAGSSGDDLMDRDLLLTEEREAGVLVHLPQKSGPVPVRPTVLAGR